MAHDKASILVGRRLAQAPTRQRPPAHEYQAPPDIIIVWASPKHNMARHSQGISATTTIILVLLLSISLFPNLFHLIWSLPLSLLPFSRSPVPKKLPTLEDLAKMSWFQKQFTLPAKSRGSYLITDQVLSQLPELRDYKVGILHLFVQHTSCALSLNENCK